MPSDSSAAAAGAAAHAGAWPARTGRMRRHVDRERPGRRRRWRSSARSGSPISRIVCRAAARSAPSWPSTGVCVPICGRRAGASAIGAEMVVEAPGADLVAHRQHLRRGARVGERVIMLSKVDDRLRDRLPGAMLVDRAQAGPRRSTRRPPGAAGADPDALALDLGIEREREPPRLGRPRSMA